MIKKFNEFNESISGRELIGPVGPNYGDTSLPNKTINTSDTSVIFSEITNKFYSYDEYQEIYNDYLKKGGTPLHGFNKENLEIIVHSIYNQ